MKQIVKNSDGKIEIIDVPPPLLGENELLIKVKETLISTGTEIAGLGGGGFIGRNATDVNKIKSVVQNISELGLDKTINKIRSKISAKTPLGYSGAGIVEAVGSKVKSYNLGDRVAYMGASHAEKICISHQMAAHIPQEVTFSEAAFGAVGCIAMQGVRLGEIELGDCVLILGLGLVGLQVVQLAKANGAHVIAIDPIKSRRDLAKDFGASIILDPIDEKNIEQAIVAATGGVGVDCAFLCAGKIGEDVTNQMLNACRQQGRVVMIGDMGLNLDRAPLFSKELSFKVSRSYGPGRYDVSVEEKGLDYPIGYVRWTAKRNLECFLKLLQDKRIDLKSMLGNSYNVDEATEAYQNLQEERGLASRLVFGNSSSMDDNPCKLRAPTVVKDKNVQVAIIGCGSFVKSNLLPHFKKLNASVYGICNKTSKQFPELKALYNPLTLTTEVQELIDDERIDAFIVGTRHDSHYSLSKKLLMAGKVVHVEKPMTLTLSEAEDLYEISKSSEGFLTVGYNRRFSPDVIKLKTKLSEGQPEERQLLYRINGPILPIDHWILDEDIGGGRLVGEGCHFIDLLCYISGAEVVNVALSQTSSSISSPLSGESFSMTLKFSNGDVGTIVYTAQGNSEVPKERLEVFSQGKIFEIVDFTGLRIHGQNEKAADHKTDKGFFGHLQNFFAAVRGEEELVTSIKDGFRVAQVIHDANARD